MGWHTNMSGHPIQSRSSGNEGLFKSIYFEAAVYGIITMTVAIMASIILDSGT
jgi:hypothetical protein